MELLQETELAVKTEVGVGTKVIGGIIVGLTASLLSGYLMAGFLASENGFTHETTQKNGSPLSQRAFQVALEAYNGSTCGTYTGDRIPGGEDDGGYWPPFVKSGAVDLDCHTQKNGDAVCYQNGAAPCLLAAPTPPAVTVDAARNNTARVSVKWFTNGITTSSRAMFVNKSAYPEGWRCFYDATYNCPAGAIDSVLDMGDGLSAEHQTYPVILPSGLEYYFVVAGQDQSTGIQLHSEVRTFSTVLPSPSR